MLSELANDLAFGIRTLRARAAQQRGQAQLRLQASALDAAANAMVITDRDASILWVNPAFCTLTGYAASEVLGRNPRLLKSGAQDGEFYRAMYQSLLAGSVWRGEVVNRYKDGRLNPEEMTITPLRGGDGKITHFIAIKQDISERKRLQRLQHDRSRVLESVSARAALSVTLELITTSVEMDDETALCSILLLDEAGQHLLLGAAPSLPDVYNQAIDGVAIGVGVGSCGTAAATGQRVIVADVQTHPYWVDYRELAHRANLRSCWSEPILSGAGKVLGTFAIYHREPREPEGMDIERIQSAAALARVAIESEQAHRSILNLNATLEWRVAERTASLDRANIDLRENATRFQTLANNISQFAWMADAQGSIFWYNQRWFDYTGTTLEEMSGWGWQKVHHPDHVQGVTDKIKRCFETGAVWEDTFPLRGTDGQYRWFLSRAVPIRDEHGTVLRWFGTNTDVTERKQLEMELEDAKLVAEESNRAKSDFLANMSHELRTPLNAIIGFSEMLKDGVLGELEAKQREFVGDIFTSGTHLLSLINDILDLSKVEAGKLQLDARPVELAALLQASTMIVREKAMAHRIRLETQLDAALGSLLADERKVKQIVYNLLAMPSNSRPRAAR